MLDLDNGDKVPAKITYMKDSDLFEIDEIDFDKITVSKKYLHKKEYESYKRYIFYEDNNEYVPLKIILKDVTVYYNKHEDGDGRGMIFRINCNLEDKFYDIFEDIREK